MLAYVLSRDSHGSLCLALLHGDCVIDKAEMVVLVEPWSLTL